MVECYWWRCVCLMVWFGSIIICFHQQTGWLQTQFPVYLYLPCPIPLKFTTFLAQSNHVLINLQIKAALKIISECIVCHRQIKISQHISHPWTMIIFWVISNRMPRSHIQNIKITLWILKELQKRRLLTICWLMVHCPLFIHKKMI